MKTVGIVVASVLGTLVLLIAVSGSLGRGTTAPEEVCVVNGFGNELCGESAVASCDLLHRDGVPPIETTRTCNNVADALEIFPPWCKAGRPQDREHNDECVRHSEAVLRE